MQFTNEQKRVLDYFFTSSLEGDTVYAARPTLPSIIITYLIGRASRASKTFREIFLEMWEEVGGMGIDFSVPQDTTSFGIDKAVQDMAQKSEEFMSKWGNHNSLRDTPHLAVFCDQLTILQTKVWEQEPVGAYQEKSTRYRPFVATNIWMPDVSPQLKEVVNSHLDILVALYDTIMEATNKRDVARYLLPVGAMTAMGCMAPLRSWERIVGRMLLYPTTESSILAEEIKKHIQKLIPSFKPDMSVPDYDYLRTETEVKSGPTAQVAAVRTLGGEVFKILGLIDIGAHRDLQRHRSVIQGLHDYRAIYGYDMYMPVNYLDEILRKAYMEAMESSTLLYRNAFLELKNTEKVGEAQFLTLLGHMTPFYYITDYSRWEYIYRLRTGHPSQKATTSQTVHFSYANWCHRVQEQMEIIFNQTGGCSCKSM